MDETRPIVSFFHQRFVVGHLVLMSVAPALLAIVLETGDIGAKVVAHFLATRFSVLTQVTQLLIEHVRLYFGVLLDRVVSERGKACCDGGHIAVAVGERDSAGALRILELGVDVDGSVEDAAEQAVNDCGQLVFCEEKRERNKLRNRRRRMKWNVSSAALQAVRGRGTPPMKMVFLGSMLCKEPMAQLVSASDHDRICMSLSRQLLLDMCVNSLLSSRKHLANSFLTDSSLSKTRNA